MHINQIENFISAIRDSHSEMRNIFTQGSCWNFYLILRRVFPDSQPYYNINHVVSKIGDRFYDINGDVTREVLKNGHYSPFFTIYSRAGIRRAISQMTRAEYNGRIAQLDRAFAYEAKG
jgi:hypothetical protein